MLYTLVVIDVVDGDDSYPDWFFDRGYHLYGRDEGCGVHKFVYVTPNGLARFPENVGLPKGWRYANSKDGDALEPRVLEVEVFKS